MLQRTKSELFSIVAGRFKAKTKPKWANEEVDISMPLNQIFAERDKDSKEPKKVSKSPPKPIAGSDLAADFFGSPPNASSAPAKAVPAKKQADSFDLLGFDAFPVTPTPSTAAIASNPAATKSAADDFFGTAATSSVDDIFGAFSAFGGQQTASSAAAPSQNSTEKNTNSVAAKTAQILSLYSTATQVAINNSTNNNVHNFSANAKNPFGSPVNMGMSPMGMNNMGMNQMAMPQMGVNNMAMNQMGMNPMGMNQMNPMGMNQMGMNPMGMNSMGAPIGMGQQPIQPPMTNTAPASSLNSIDPFASF